MSNAVLLAINVGNSRVSFAAYSLTTTAPGRPRAVAVFTAPRAGEAFRPKFSVAGVSVAVMASVNPGAARRVAEWCRTKFGVRPLVFPDDVPAPLWVRYRPVASLGADRLANAVAAYAEAGAACVVVDAGTAVTVDTVSKDGVFLGGAILPGLGLQLNSLARGTALLPKAGAALPRTATGSSTEESIRSGVYHGIAGAVDRLADAMAAETMAKHVFVTGGDAEWLMSLCRKQMARRPCLTTNGLAIAFAKTMA